MILTILEHDRGALHSAAPEALAVARSLAQQSGSPLAAALVGGHEEIAGALAGYGASAVHLVAHDRLDSYLPEAWGRALAQLVEKLQPQAVVAAGSDRGNELMAHVAAILDQPLAANVTAVAAGEPYQVTRVRWGGSLLEEAELDGSPALMTVALHAVEPAWSAAGGPAPTVERFSPTLDERAFRVRLSEQVAAREQGVSLADAPVVVGGGRGVGSAEGFAPLEELAALLGGAVGGSRVVTNLGWRPHADQIGQTGTRIAPELYIACGISGAIQHMVGARGSKQILAINADPEAPIMAKANYTVTGDLHKVLPALIEEIKKMKGV
jgi:electron transfer flavoprotein alpha subunit